MAEKIINVDYESEIGQSMVNYAMSVITDRALPDVRDGLKPVQRRVLYTLNDLAKPNLPHRKSARIVGDTMGKYHPHGDSSIYEGLVNMAQAWKMPIPLVDGHGNFGAVDGSGAASMRYTEARLSKYMEDVCFKDIQYFKDSFIQNFDGTEIEPTFLPFQIPNVLVSGSMGIAVGMATNIPTHNLGEVIDLLIAYLNSNKSNPLTIDDCLEIMPCPDFATGGLINANRETLLQIYSTGLGKIKVRGKVEVRDIGYGRKSICVTELPFTMINGTEKFLNTVAELVRNRELPQVVDIADRGDKDGECLCIDVKKGTTDQEINNIINILYKKAGLENTFGVNMNILNKGKPEVMGILRILELFTEFKYECYNTKYEKLLAEQIKTKEVKEGLVEAIDIVDLIIEILRGAKNRADAKECLMTGRTDKIKFRYEGSELDARNLCFTELQADAILNMRLSALIGLELEILKKELKEADRLLKKYEKLLGSKAAMKNQMIEDLTEIKDKYALPRRTVLVDEGEVKLEKVKEVATEVAVLLDRFYYIKVIDGNIYDKNEDQILKDYQFSCKCMSDQRIGIFSDNKNFYSVKIGDIIKAQAKKIQSESKNKKGAAKPKTTGGGVIGKLSDKGVQIFDFCGMNKDKDNILYMNCVENFVTDETKELLIVCKNAFGKRVPIAEFDVSKKMVLFTKAEEEVSLVQIIDNTARDDKELLLVSNDGYYKKMNLEEVPVKSKTSKESKLYNLADGDELTGCFIGNSKSDFVNPSNGKSYSFSRIQLSKRGGKGTKVRL